MKSYVKRYGYRDCRTSHTENGYGIITYDEWHMLRHGHRSEPLGKGVTKNTWSLYMYLVVRVSNRTAGKEWYTGITTIQKELCLPESSVYEALASLKKIGMIQYVRGSDGTKFVELIFR